MSINYTKMFLKYSFVHVSRRQRKITRPGDLWPQWSLGTNTQVLTIVTKWTTNLLPWRFGWRRLSKSLSLEEFLA